MRERLCRALPPSPNFSASGPPGFAPCLVPLGSGPALPAQPVHPVLSPSQPEEALQQPLPTLRAPSWAFLTGVLCPLLHIYRKHFLTPCPSPATTCLSSSPLHPKPNSPLSQTHSGYAFAQLQSVLAADPGPSQLSSPSHLAHGWFVALPWTLLPGVQTFELCFPSMAGLPPAPLWPQLVSLVSIAEAPSWVPFLSHLT